MMEQYFRILDKNLIARREGFLSGSIYMPGKGWQSDEDHILSDRLIGYDGGIIGNGDMLEQLEEITKEEALSLTQG